jgi:ABC-type amino acid transport system permease subunit
VIALTGNVLVLLAALVAYAIIVALDVCNAVGELTTNLFLTGILKLTTEIILGTPENTQ